MEAWYMRRSMHSASATVMACACAAQSCHRYAPGRYWSEMGWTGCMCGGKGTAVGQAAGMLGGCLDSMRKDGLRAGRVRDLSAEWQPRCGVLQPAV